MAHGQRLLQDEASLRHGAFKGINQQQNAVHHVQDALHFTAEVRMAGGIDDIDLHRLALLWAGNDDRRVLCQDCDPALAFQIVGIEDALGHLLVLSKHLRLF